MLVDEYQDTNVVQYLWLRLLAGTKGNVCVVGDDDQSIYGWRGAEVENILQFEKDFPGAKVIRLERNYRSTPAILGAASGLIAANKGRLGKTLWTEGETGEKIKVQGVWDAEEEARNVAAEAEDLHRQGHAFSQMAVLVRASFQMREFEDRFLSLGIPYRVIGGPRFYERAEIRDAMAYLRLVAQGDDDLAFERIVNKPKRGIGDASVQRAASLRPRAADSAADGGARDCRHRRGAAQGAQIAGRAGAGFRALDGERQTYSAYGPCRNGAGRMRLYRHAQARQIARSAGPARQPQGTGALDGGVRDAGRVPRACQPGHGRGAERERGQGQSDDHARGQGAGVRHRVPARLGGRPVPEPAHHGRRRARRASRRSAGSPMSA